MAIWTNRPSTSLPRNITLELRSLIEHKADLLRFIGAARTHAASENPAEVIASISEELQSPAEVLRPVFNALENLKNLSEEYGSAKGAIDELSKGLDSETSKAFEKARDDILRAVDEYSSDNAMSVAYKAQKLTYLRENVYQEGDLITDVRPVFNSSGSEVMEYLITHYFVATYFRHGRVENIHLAMDMADVVKLRRICDRVIVKTHTLKQELGSKAKVLRDDDAAS